MTSLSMMLLRLVYGQRGITIYRNWRHSVHNLRNKLMISEETNKRAAAHQAKIENDLIKSLKH